MVAKIKSGQSLRGALNYNENKVKQQKATLIYAAGYLKATDVLSFYDKLYRLTDLAVRNQRTKTNTVHISLNFAIGEKLPSQLLKQISEDYMKGIGFEHQPYLVYQHLDAGHPHLHIVSTNIQKNGERLSLHNLGQNESEKARKAIEIKYQLVKAEGQAKQKPELHPLPAEYGKAETKRSITNIVNQVVRTYRFTSIPELNAVLQAYHVQADRGVKESRLNTKGGLIYWLTDKTGNKVGVPIKASSIYGKPTLKYLEERFRLNETLRRPFRDHVKAIIGKALENNKDCADFEKKLKAQNIEVLFRRNTEGRIYGVTFIDHANKAVFNGSDLGKEFSANPLNERFSENQAHQSTPFIQPMNPVEHDSKQDDLLDILLQPEKDDIAALSKFKKKKRKGHYL